MNQDRHWGVLDTGTLIGTLALSFWIILVITSTRLPFISSWQLIPAYKAATGTAMYFLMLVQFRLTIRRFYRVKKPNFSFVEDHKRIGNWLPVLLFAHTGDIGYGITMLLNCTLVMNQLIAWYGLRIKGRWYFGILSVHIVLSILVFSLATYHLVIASTYH